jgi:hypothetical protein
MIVEYGDDYLVRDEDFLITVQKEWMKEFKE